MGEGRGMNHRAGHRRSRGQSIYRGNWGKATAIWQKSVTLYPFKIMLIGLPGAMDHHLPKPSCDPFVFCQPWSQT